jgi:hypothetical protein
VYSRTTSQGWHTNPGQFSTTPINEILDVQKIRVLVADDHALFREGVNALLAATPDIVVVGEAANGEDVITSLKPTQRYPDDINMPGSWN